MQTQTTRPPLWNIPYQRNPFFTGREDMLNILYRTLQIDNTIALSHPQGISGLGGIGKTQTALEYAYRYGMNYDAVFWVRAESTITLISSFVEMAHLLKLQERNEQNQNLIVEAVLHWLHIHSGWLLIFDNMDNLLIAEPFLPKAGSGHILLTTRSRSLGGIAQFLEVQKMEPETGALLLLRRASILPLQATLELATRDDNKLAMLITQELDGLPLALDQAGAYIKETPCSLQDYLALYEARRHTLLQTRGNFEKDYPASVATTWSLSFEKVEKTNSAASKLLDLFAFLAADAIPEGILTEGNAQLGLDLQEVVADPIELNVAIKTLLAYSLVQRDTDLETDLQVLGIHRLVQVVIKDTMSQHEQQTWIQRAVQAIGKTFPYVKFDVWRACDLWLPHAQICIDYIHQNHIQTLEVARLLNQTGMYLQKRGRDVEAELPLQKALEVKESLLGTEHLEVAESLNMLAEFYRFQSKYAESERLHKRALLIRQHCLGEMHLSVAESLNNLAFVYRAGGRYIQAEPLQRQALEIRKKEWGLEHPGVAVSLDTMAGLFRAMGQYSEAEAYYQQALEIRKRTLDEKHPYIAVSLSNLAGYYRALERFEESKLLYEQALEIRKHIYQSTEHPEIALSFHGLAEIHTEMGNYQEAEHLFDQALRIKEQTHGKAHWDVARMLNGKAILFVDLKRYEEAEALYKQSLAIWRKTPGLEIADEEENLKNLALEILEKVLGLHTDVARSLERLAVLYSSKGEEKEIEPLLVRALQIREQVQGPTHISLINGLNTLAALYLAQGRSEEAATLSQRAQNIIILP